MGWFGMVNGLERMGSCGAAYPVVFDRMVANNVNMKPIWFDIQQ